MRIIFYIFLLLFPASFINAIHPKNRFDDYEQSEKEEEFDFNDLRSKAKKFNIDGPDGNYKLVAELKKAHGRNLQLQSYISDLLDIWIFRSAIKDVKNGAVSNSDSKNELVEILPANKIKEVEKLREGVKKATNVNLDKPATNSADPVAHVLDLITAIKTQATLVLKRANELEKEILTGTENTKKLFRNTKLSASKQLNDLNAGTNKPTFIGKDRPYPYSWLDSILNATNKLLGTAQAQTQNEQIGQSNFENKKS